MLSAQRHVAMYEEMIAKHKARIEADDPMSDEATTRRWIAMDEATLAGWRAALKRAENEAAGPMPGLV